VNSRAWIRIAGIVVGLIAAVVLAVAVPHPLWTSGSVVAASFLVLSLYAPLLLPMPQPQMRSSGNAAAIWLIGPMSTWVALLFCLSAIALWLGLDGPLTACWILDIVWVGVLGAGWAALRASTGVVTSAAAQVISASDDARTEWISLLKAQAQNSQRVRYAANSRMASAEHVAIAQVLARIEPVANQPEELRGIARVFEGLLEQRELSIRASRTRA